MSTQSLGSIASQVVGHYEEAGKLIVGAYRTGASRLVTRASERYTSYLDGQSLPLIGDKVKAGLVAANERFTGFVEQAIERDTARAEKVIGFVADSVQKGIRRLADRVADAEAATEVVAETAPAKRAARKTTRRARG